MRAAHQPLFKDRGVRVNAVSPGPVTTPILKEFRQIFGDPRVDDDIARVGRAGSAPDIAPAVAVPLLGRARAGSTAPICRSTAASKPRSTRPFSGSELAARCRYGEGRSMAEPPAGRSVQVTARSRSPSWLVNKAGIENAQRNLRLDRRRPHAGACASASLCAKQSAAGRRVSRRHPKDRGGRRVERGSDAA